MKIKFDGEIYESLSISHYHAVVVKNANNEYSIESPGHHNQKEVSKLLTLKFLVPGEYLYTDGKTFWLGDFYSVVNVTKRIEEI